MSYIINRYNGSLLVTVPDGTINTTTTSLGLIGRSVTEYGTVQNENYVYLLENFSNSTAPLQPILGQLWYNSDTDVLSAYSTGNTWVSLVSTASPAFTGTPTAPTATPGTNTTQSATTAFVTAAIAAALA